MATPFIGLSSAAKGRERLYAYKCNTAGLLEGAVFMFDGSAAGRVGHLERDQHSVRGPDRLRLARRPELLVVQRKPDPFVPPRPAKELL